MSESLLLDNSTRLTDRKRRQIENAMLAAIVESSDDAIISKTLDGTITTWNGAAERIFDYTAKEAIGQPIMILLPLERLNEETDILARLRRGERIDHFETIRLSKSGGQIHVSLSVAPIKNAQGRIVGASKILRDISERKRAETSMQWQQSAMEHMARLNTMGEMAAGLAHELNQPLASILTYTGVSLEAVRSKTASTDRLASALAEVASETHRAGEIIRRLRDFIRKRDPGKEPVDVNLIVQDSLHLLAFDFNNSQIQPKLNLQPDLPRIMGDSVQLVQVLVNLLRNARDAMIDPAAHGRELSVTTSLIDRRVRIQVTDQGCGMDPEQLNKLFNRFFTNKAAGLGMGLAISKTIIESFEGNLTGMLNLCGKGMTFSITLPSKAAEKEQYECAEYSLCRGR